MSEVELARPSAENRESFADFESLLSDLSSRFISLPPEEVDREIEEGLRRICEPLGIELAVLWQWASAAPEVIRPTHIYAAREELRPSAPIREDQYPWFRRQMLAGRTVVLAEVADLPEEAALDLASCRLHGVQSVVCLPLALGGEKPIGALGFNVLQSQRSWPTALVNRLQLVGQIFTHAIARRRHDQILAESETRMRAGAELAGLAFYEVDFGAGAMFIDQRAREICGFPPDREDGLEALEFWLEHLHPDDRPHMLDQRQQLHDGRVKQLSIEYRFLHPSLGERWIHHLAGVLKRDADGRTVKSFGVLRDITEGKVAEEERRDLSRRLIRAHEEERAILARELHDDLTQRLAILAIDIGRAELAAPDTAQGRTMRSVREGLVRLSEDVHALATQLHPSVLSELGLEEALRAECERVGRQGGVDLSVEIAPIAPGLGKDVALCLFRVAQEALNNSFRHASARRASLALRPIDGGLVLAVADDGIGFDPEGPGTKRSLGLASMRERVWLVGGTLDIESTPGQGVTILVWVPAQEASQ